MSQPTRWGDNASHTIVHSTNHHSALRTGQIIWKKLKNTKSFFYKKLTARRARHWCRWRLLREAEADRPGSEQSYGPFGWVTLCRPLLRSEPRLPCGKMRLIYRLCRAALRRLWGDHVANTRQALDEWHLLSLPRVFSSLGFQEPL